MVEILTVCTGNICRSPLAALVLRERLHDLGVTVASAGSHAMVGHPMTDEAQRLAIERGVAADAASAHRARHLTEAHLMTPALVLALTRAHRHHVVELAPSLLRSVFTVREFARLSATVTEAQVREAVAPATDAASRLRAAVALIAAQRGLALPPVDPTDDDVVDPYRRSWRTYQASAAQLDPGVDEVVRVVRAALG